MTRVALRFGQSAAGSRRRQRRAQCYAGTNNNKNRTLSYDALDRMSGATAPNIYGQEITEYDVLDNVRRLVGVPNGATWQMKPRERLLRMK